MFTLRGGEGGKTHKSRPFARLAAVLVASHLLDRWPRKPPLRTIVEAIGAPGAAHLGLSPARSRPEVRRTPGITRRPGGPRCVLHCDAPGAPHLPPSSGYRIYYISFNY